MRKAVEGRPEEGSDREWRWDAGRILRKMQINARMRVRHARRVRTHCWQFKLYKCAASATVPVLRSVEAPDRGSSYLILEREIKKAVYAEAGKNKQTPNVCALDRRSLLPDQARASVKAIRNEDRGAQISTDARRRDTI